MTLWDMHRALLADERIVETYEADALVSTYYMRGWLTWEEAQGRWTRTAKMRAAAWKERRSIR